MNFTLSDLGWSNHFTRQCDPAIDTTTLFRVAEVHRDALTVLGGDGPARLTTAPELSMAEIAVGDWVQTDHAGRVDYVFDRQTLLSRRAAGSDARTQLIAANVDVLFIVSSCNADFNVARLERYLALAQSAGCFPVLVLTKADLCDDPDDYARRAAQIATMLTVLTINAQTEAAIAALTDWCRAGQTAALVGSSGVGKTTLLNGLTGASDHTAGIREDDAKGRHTTTARALRPMAGGGWIIDTPGMRALRLLDAGDGIDAVFADIAELATHCRFSDCSHQLEPGCAVQAAVQAGTLDPDRLNRWRKLLVEDQRNSETIAQSRARGKAFGKLIREVKVEMKRRNKY